MACYHFTIKTDKKPDGTKVSASTHVDYIAREGKYADYEKAEFNEQTLLNNSLFSDNPIEETTVKAQLLYRSPFGNILRSKDGVHVSENASVETVAIALGVTEKLYGGKLQLNGSDTFKAQVLVAANEMDLPLHFADNHLKQKYTQMQEEKKYVRREFERNGGSVRKPKNVSKPDFKQRTLKAVTQTGFSLPKLSERHMVSNGERSDLLLPSHEHASVLQQRAKLYRAVRWDVSGARLSSVRKVRNDILRNLQTQLDSVFAASHVQYINREAAFKQRGGCVYQNHHLPKWAKGSAKKFFAAADRYEGANRVRYKEIEFMLPNDLELEQHKEIIEKFLENHLKDFYYTYAVHNKIGVMSNGEHHPHVHIMFSERKLDDAELEKERPACRFFAYPTRNPKTLADKRKGGALKDRKWEDKYRSKYLSYMREDFAKIQNEILEKYDIPDRVDHRSLKLQRDEALVNGNLRLAELLNRLPEEHIGPEHALKKNSQKVADLQKYRAYKAEHRKLLYAADIMENSIAKDISNAGIADNSKKVKNITQLEKYKFALKTNSTALQEMKKHMLNALKEVNALNRTVIWNNDAIEMAKLKFMTLEERELWQTLKSLQEKQNHWTTFQQNFKEPAAHRQDALIAYKELRPELEKQINVLDEEIRATALKVRPISERLTSPILQKKIQQETAKILWDDKSTKERLVEANEALNIAIEQLQQELHHQVDENLHRETAYSANHLSELLSAAHSNTNMEYTRNKAALQKLESRVISYDRAIAMAKDVYVHGEFKTLRDKYRDLTKQETFLSNDKLLYEQQSKEFTSMEKPSFWQSKEVKTFYESQKQALLQKTTAIDSRETGLASEKSILDQEQARLTALCESPAGKTKIEEIAMGILRKNQPIKDKYQTLLDKTNENSQKLNHTKNQLQAVKKQARIDKGGTKYKVVSDPATHSGGGGASRPPDPATIADAILGDSKAAQLVARSKPGADEMEKEWSMMTEIEKDDKLNSIENLDRY